jgi:hypothetical protein
MPFFFLFFVLFLRLPVPPSPTPHLRILTLGLRDNGGKPNRIENTCRLLYKLHYTVIPIVVKSSKANLSSLYFTSLIFINPRKILKHYGRFYFLQQLHHGASSSKSKINPRVFPFYDANHKNLRRISSISINIRFDNVEKKLYNKHYNNSIIIILYYHIKYFHKGTCNYSSR